MEEDRSREQKTWHACCFGKINVLRFDLKESSEGFFWREGEVIPCRGAEDKKGAITNSGKSGKWYEELGG